jgi:hypothetical protein
LSKSQGASWFVVLAVGAAALVCACTAVPLAPRAVLDPASGVSLTAVDAPLILARERRDIAVQARDYLTLVAVEINDAGNRRLVWVVHQWSTIDARASGFQPVPGAPLLVVADGRDMRLNPIGDSVPDVYLGNSALQRPDDAAAATTAYAISAEDLEFVANSRHIAAMLPESRLTIPFALWRDGRPALRRFVAKIRE